MNGLTPDITAAEVVRHGVLRLTFADGLSGEVEVLDRMRGPVFEDARTPKGFAEVETDPEAETGRAEPPLPQQPRPDAASCSC
jgi:hypothetical protein